MSSSGEQDSDCSIGGDDKEIPAASVEGGLPLYTASSLRDVTRGNEGLARPSLVARRVYREVTGDNSIQRNLAGDIRQREPACQKRSDVPCADQQQDDTTGQAPSTEAATKSTADAQTLADEISLPVPLESSPVGPPMPTLRRSQPRVFGTQAASVDGVELRQPTQRLVKIQPEEGERPGAYAHQLPPRRSFVGALSSRDEEDSVLPSLFNVQRTRVEELVSEDSVDRAKRSNRWRVYLFVGIAVLIGVSVGVGAGVGVAPSESKSAGDVTGTDDIACSMTQIETECSNSTAVITMIPECLLKLREELKLRLLSLNLGMQITEDDNLCSADSLSLFSVAFHTSNEDSPPTLSNRLGLSLLFYATNGRDWTRGRDWLSSEPPCEWYGVSCGETGYVASLDMTLFNMRGNLPSRVISLLPELTSLNVWDNSLTGTLAPEFRDLNELFAGLNQFTGTVADAFFESTSLQLLSLSWNTELTLSSTSFFGTQLKWLFLDGINVESGFLSSVSMLSNLETLGLQGSNLVGTIPTEICQITSLIHLDISVNPLLGGAIPTELQNMNKLQSLLMNDCAFSGTIPTEIGNMTKLYLLELGNNRLTGGMPTELGLLKKLKTMTFHSNDLEGTIPSEVCSLVIDGVIDTFGIDIWWHASCRDLPYGGLSCPLDTPDCCIWDGFCD